MTPTRQSSVKFALAFISALALWFMFYEPHVVNANTRNAAVNDVSDPVKPIDLAVAPSSSSTSSSSASLAPSQTSSQTSAASQSNTASASASPSLTPSASVIVADKGCPAGKTTHDPLRDSRGSPEMRFRMDDGFWMLAKWARDELAVIDINSLGNRNENVKRMLHEAFDGVHEQLQSEMGPCEVRCIALFGADRPRLHSPFADCPNVAGPSGALGPEAHYTFPDFTYVSWPQVRIPSFEEQVSQIREAAKRPPTDNRMFWTGALDTNVIRVRLNELAKAHPDLLDVKPMTWYGQLSPTSPVQGSSSFISLPDHTKYKYLIDLPGKGYSGRLKYLLHTHRLMFLVEREAWEYSSAALEPGVHYIAIKADLSNLVDSIRWANEHPVEAQQIADNMDAYALQRVSHDAAITRMKNILLYHNVTRGLTSQLIVSNNHENLDWHPDTPIPVARRDGRDSVVYLEYIVDQYPVMTDTIVFVRGTQMSDDREDIRLMLHWVDLGSYPFASLCSKWTQPSQPEYENLKAWWNNLDLKQWIPEPLPDSGSMMSSLCPGSS